MTKYCTQTLLKERLSKKQDNGYNNILYPRGCGEDIVYSLSKTSDA